MSLPLRLDYAAALLYLQVQTASASGFSRQTFRHCATAVRSRRACTGGGGALDEAPGILRARWGADGLGWPQAMPGKICWPGR